MAKQSQETTNALTQKGIDDLVRDLNNLNQIVSENDRTYYVVFVSKEEFTLIRSLVFGFAGMILVAFVAAAIKLLIR